MATTLPCWAIPDPCSLSVSQLVPTVAHCTVLAGNAKHPTDRFLDAQLGELCALHRRVRQIIRRLQRRMSACQEGVFPIDVFTALVLVRLVHETQQLEALIGQVVHHNRQSLRQVQVSYRQQNAERGRP